MNSKVLIASVYGPSDRSEDWYKLQKKFIKMNTTCDFEYKIVLNGIQPTRFHPEDILLENGENIGHAPALQQILEHFKTAHYDAYLILDSDCFPIYRGWHALLLDQMTEHDKQMAAPVRTENLDTFPHPCAFFMTREGLYDPRLDFANAQTGNLLGEPFPPDVGARMNGMTDTVLPLLRTNVVNVHPMAAGIYHHLFYHHHAGSRNFNCRVIDRYKYYDHWYDRMEQTAHVHSLEKKLFRNPERFIKKLTGKSERWIKKYLVN